MDFLGYFCALFVGISLGLFGGGGSILTVPILTYMFAVPPPLGTAYSLFIVGITSLMGVYFNYLEGNLRLKLGFVFGLPSCVGVYLVRRWGLPLISEVIDFGGITISKDSLIMLTFGVVMLTAALFMLNVRPKQSASAKINRKAMFVIAAEGFVVGGITGFVGAGGGFLIIPTLVLLAGLPIKKAVGTSLLIISIKSISGFIGDLQATDGMEWAFLMVFTGLTLSGLAIGSYVSKRIDSKQLQPAFGWFVFMMASLVLTREIGL